MRTLLLLRGAPGCGKSTWIERHGLKPYTLSADDIRLLYQSPMIDANGQKYTSQSNDSMVWKTLFSILETRMKNGEFTVIDATNSKTKEMNRYKDMCATYRYRIYCVDFTDVPVEEAKRRNSEREQFKQVPDAVIDNMYSRFATQKVPSGITVIKPDELEKVWLKLYDFSEYKAVYHIGDIHGCYTALNELINTIGGLKDDCMYIFTGDYIDRGIENADTLKFLISIMNQKNVLLLEGNHERWLWRWAHDCPTQSREFELVTKSELENSDISKKDVRAFYRKLGQCAYYKYNGDVFLVTHGGLSAITDNLSLIATEQMIKGAGNYNDFEAVADAFYNSTPSNFYQIFGHRNPKSLPVRMNKRVFNLEGKVEFGGYLRCVKIDGTGFQEYEIKNNVCKTTNDLKKSEDVLHSSIADLVLKLRNNKYIQEKQFGQISSFNYSSKAFYDKAWDEETVKARGLYIDTEKMKVVARAYDKFFNINERPETQFDMLQYKLKFPVKAYVKENGFLGIVSYDSYKDELFITTKSTPEGDYAKWFKELLTNTYSSEQLDFIKSYTKSHDVSFVFECIDMKHDPHIIEYPESKVVLLDIVNNDIEFSKYSYDDMRSIAEEHCMPYKEQAYQILSWQDFFDWYYDVLKDDYKYHGREIEGFVIEDDAGFMTKLKLAYYSFWKHMRSVTYETLRRGHIQKTSALTMPLANQYYYWIKNKREELKDSDVPTDICNLRKEFYNDMKTIGHI